jgi:hypothetical protein
MESLLITGHECPGEGAEVCTRSLTSVLEWGGFSTPPPGRRTSGKDGRYHFNRRLGGLRGPCRKVRKISPSPDFETRTVQTVASRCTMYLAHSQVSPSDSLCVRFLHAEQKCSSIGRYHSFVRVTYTAHARIGPLPPVCHRF